MQWEDFARPSVAVDVAVLTVVPEPQPWLGLLVHRRGGEAYRGRWDIPGGFVRAGETLVDAVLRLLREKSGVRGLQPTQLNVFDDPHRDERGWVMSVAHMDAVPFPRLTAAMTSRDDVQIVPVTEVEGRILVQVPGRHRRLPWDHDEIVTMAVQRLRQRYTDRPDPDGLVLSADVGEDQSLETGDVGAAEQLPREYAWRQHFTLTELRRVHEAVAGHPLQRDSFRRAVEPHLRRTARTSEGRVGRPGTLYLRAD
jgi:ADP-ribose pyrophosphatase YjhB (NUDIX family)